MRGAVLSDVYAGEGVVRALDPLEARGARVAVVDERAIGISDHQAEGTVAHVHESRRAVFADSEAIEQILPFEEGLPRVAYVLVKDQPAVRCAQDEVLVSISVNI